MASVRLLPKNGTAGARSGLTRVSTEAQDSGETLNSITVDIISPRNPHDDNIPVGCSDHDHHHVQGPLKPWQGLLFH